MVRIFATIAFLAAVLAMSRPASAQTSSLTLSKAREAEVGRWIDDFTAWQAWWAEWKGRREPGWFTSARTRREKPAPPDWLAQECEAPVDHVEPMASACTLLKQWAEDDLTLELRQDRATRVADSEKPSTITWWEHLHVDLVAPALQAQSGIIGVGGMHASLNVKGRLQMFAGPGVMFVSLPTANGGRAWKVATNYGIGFRLFDFVLPGGRPATAHFNLAKAWLLSEPIDLVASRTMDFFTFSISFKKVH
jgi:hypothetical protein